MTNIINEKYMLTNENIIKLLPNINSKNNNRQFNKQPLNKITNNGWGKKCIIIELYQQRKH